MATDQLPRDPSDILFPWKRTSEVLPQDGWLVLLLASNRRKVYFAKWDATRNCFMVALRTDGAFNTYRHAPTDIWAPYP